MQRIFKRIEVNDLPSFKRRLLQLSKHFEHFCLLESNDYALYPHSNFGFFVAIDSLHHLPGNCGPDYLSALQAFHDLHRDWMFGYLSYELKNQIEPTLESANHDGIQCPVAGFFIPKFLLKFHNGHLDLGVVDESHRREFQTLMETEAPSSRDSSSTMDLDARMSENEYIHSVNALKDHIQRGDIYETNFCMEFFASGCSMDPVITFESLNARSRAPFGAFMREGDIFLMCSSPERYLKRWQQLVVSQPIKGTIKRGSDRETDELLKDALLWDPKERSENVMIVDLVRNDLSRIAIPGTVQVEELFGIYTFEQVHQMISSVICKVREQEPFTEIIRSTFPMGSMTGAPKFSAMQLIDKYEKTVRGLYSGAVGYVTPQGNFDFNVVIRSIVYNQLNHYTSVQVGSALTIECDAEKEYEECLLKAKAMRNTLKEQ